MSAMIVTNAKPPLSYSDEQVSALVVNQMQKEEIIAVQGEYELTAVAHTQNLKLVVPLDTQNGDFTYVRVNHSKVTKDSNIQITIGGCDPQPFPDSMFTIIATDIDDGSFVVSIQHVAGSSFEAAMFINIFIAVY